MSPGSCDSGTQTSVEMTSDPGYIPTKLNTKDLRISHSCWLSCGVRAMRKWVPPDDLRILVRRVCWSGMVRLGPDSLKKMWGFRGKGGSEEGRELFIPATQVESRSSTQRGSMPFSINLLTARAAAYY